MTYAVEIYARAGAQRVDEHEVAAAGAALRAEGHAITFLGSLAIPGDEMTFWLFDATTTAIEALLRRLGVMPERVVEAVATLGLDESDRHQVGA